MGVCRHEHVSVVRHDNVSVVAQMCLQTQMHDCSCKPVILVASCDYNCTFTLPSICFASSSFSALFSRFVLCFPFFLLCVVTHLTWSRTAYRIPSSHEPLAFHLHSQEICKGLSSDPQRAQIEERNVRL